MVRDEYLPRMKRAKGKELFSRHLGPRVEGELLEQMKMSDQWSGRGEDMARMRRAIGSIFLNSCTLSFYQS